MTDCLSVCLSVCPSVCLCVCLSGLRVYVSVCLSVCLPCVSVCLSMCLSVWPACLFVYLYARLSVYVSVCLASVSMCLFVYLYARLYVYVSVCLACVSMCLCVCLFVCPACLSVCVSHLRTADYMNLGRENLISNVSLTLHVFNSCIIESSSNISSFILILDNQVQVHDFFSIVTSALLRKALPTLLKVASHLFSFFFPYIFRCKIKSNIAAINFSHFFLIT